MNKVINVHQWVTLNQSNLEQDTIINLLNIDETLFPNDYRLHLFKEILKEKDNYDRQASQRMDRILGLNITKAEAQGNLTEIKSVLGGYALWSERRVDRIENYLTSYHMFHDMLKKFKLKPNQTVVDIGCAYARLGFLIGMLYPESKFIGYDINSTRLDEAKRVRDKLKLDNVDLIEQDLSADNFHLPEADLYYAYHPVNAETRDKLFKKDLFEIAKKKQITVCGRYSELVYTLSRTKWLERIDYKNKYSEIEFYKSNLI